MIGSGESVLVTARSARAMTAVVALAVLLPGEGSVVALAALALLERVEPSATPAPTRTTIVKAADSLAATVPLEKTMFPVPPTAGALVAHPVPVVTVAETNVVFVGTASVTVAVCALLGPLLVRVTVYVRSV